MTSDISIVVVSYNVRELLKQCLESILSTSNGLKVEILVVDNNSWDGTVDMIRTYFPSVRLIINQNNEGFATANNQAIRVAQGRCILLLNPDTVVTQGALKQLFDLVVYNPHIGVAGPKLINPDGTLQTSCRSFPNVLDMSLYSFAKYSLVPRTKCPVRPILFAWEHSRKAVIPGFLLGAALMIRSELFHEIGFLDPGYFVYGEEKDFCYRVAEAGYEIVFDPSAEIIHYGGQSSTQVKQHALEYLYDSHCYFLYKHYVRWYAELLIIILYAGLLARFLGSLILDLSSSIRKRNTSNRAPIYWHVFCNRKSWHDYLERLKR